MAAIRLNRPSLVVELDACILCSAEGSVVDGTSTYWYIPDPAHIPAPYSDPANTTASGTNTDAAFHITTQTSGIQKPTPGVRNRPTGSVLRPYYGPITYFLCIPASRIRIRHLYPPFPSLQ